jgi:hypothetical protein
LSSKDSLSLCAKNKKAAVRPPFVKEARRKGKALREGDAQCSPSLRQDTRIEEVSNLGRGLKSFLKLYGLFRYALI